MGYLHIDNLYKDKTVLLFKRCYALEKIHGTSCHVSWKHETKEIIFFSGGESHERFCALFDKEFLIQKFIELFPYQDVTIYGEGYGGKQQGMSATYGKELKFIGFDVQIGDVWLNVPNAHDVCTKLNLEFVDYEEITTDLAEINAERDKDSIQAIRNGVGTGKKREGVVLRPTVEMTLNNGKRVIAKHKRDEFRETTTPRIVDVEKLRVLNNAKEIASEWVTPNRLEHVLQKLPPDINIEGLKLVIKAMMEDVLREAKGEIVESREVLSAIGSATAILFKTKLKAVLI